MNTGLGRRASQSQVQIDAVWGRINPLCLGALVDVKNDMD